MILTPMIGVADAAAAAGAPAVASLHPAAVATDWFLEIPSLRFGADTQIGDQSSMDEGNVTLFDGWGPHHRTRRSRNALDRRAPIEPRVSVPQASDLRVNQIVNISSSNNVCTYRITSRTLAPRDAVPSVVYGNDPARVARRFALALAVIVSFAVAGWSPTC
jgi:hypothetical protein